MKNQNDCEHDNCSPLLNGELGESKCNDCGMEFLYCHTCSLAGCAERAIYHADPCKLK